MSNISNLSMNYLHLTVWYGYKKSYDCFTMFVLSLIWPVCSKLVCFLHSSHVLCFRYQCKTFFYKKIWSCNPPMIPFYQWNIYTFSGIFNDIKTDWDKTQLVYIWVTQNFFNSVCNVASKVGVYFFDIFQYSFRIWP